MSSVNDDDDVTSPDLGGEFGDGDEPTVGNSSPFGSISASLHRTVRSVATLAEAGEGLRGDERRRVLWALALKLGELGDLAHDTRRVLLALIRKENER
jgi:hypothetical protein